MEKETGKNQIQRPCNYEIFNELGSDNPYDKAATLAQLVGTQQGNRELVHMGTKLSQLIQTIPYDHDHFYKVQAMTREIERRLERFKEVKTLDFFSLKQGQAAEVVFSFLSNRGRYELEIRTNRNIDRDERNDIQREALSILHRLSGAQFDENDFEKEVIGVSGAQCINRYYRNTDRILVYFSGEWRHENGTDYGFSDVFYFNNEKRARSVWNELKKKLERSASK